MDDESRGNERPRPRLVWEAGLDRSGWPKPPSFWTEEHAAEIRRNHGLEADHQLIPIHGHGAALDEKYRGFDLLIVGSPCHPDGFEELAEIGIPRLVLWPPIPRHERRELAIWLARIERPGNPLRIEQRVSLRGDFIHSETIVTGLDGRHTSDDYTAIRAGLGLLGVLSVKRGRDRDLDLAQAVQAATMLMGPSFHQPTEQEVWDAVADIETTHWSAIRSRWRRSDPPITIHEVRELAKKSAPPLHLLGLDEDAIQ